MLAARWSPVHAGGQEEAVVRFDLPPQPLAVSLAAFGRITGHSVLVTSSLMAHREAAGLHGDYAPRDALDRLLVGTDLAARYISGNAFTLVPLHVDAPASPAAQENAPAGMDRREADVTQLAYAVVLQRAITRVLCIAQPDTFGRYRLAVQLWVDSEGLVSAARLLEGSGVRERDAAVVERLRSLDLETTPPSGLAQPLTILLTPRANPQRDCRPYRGNAG